VSHKVQAVALYKKAVEAVHPKNIYYPLDYNDGKEITLLGSGKAVIEMARAVLQKDIKIKKSFLVTPYEIAMEGLDIFISSHPTPSARSEEAAEKMMDIVSSLKESDFFVYLLSGGSSALLEKPIFPVEMKDFIVLTQLLLQSGASIDEINIVRKHLSRIKGGRLGEMSCAKGQVFVISDVIGDDLEAIGSAPLYCDSSSCEDAKRVLVQYNLWKQVPSGIRNVIEKCHYETPKTPNPLIDHTIVASNRMALNAAAEEAEKMGYEVHVVSDKVEGNVRDVAKLIIDYALKVENQKPACLLFGGETTVEVTGNGKGGRNQELALWVLKQKPKELSLTFLSAGSDGIDGMSEAAGAVVDGSDLHEDIDYYLENNDSFHYHRKCGTLIQTGESGTNVMDIMILIKE
jgi:hydroxypyruvate reductase/glycerate 2-kinase